MSDQAFGVAFAHELARETWGLYSLGVLFVGLRTFSRVRKLGLRGLDLDDYIMYVSLAFYTLLIVALNLVAQSAGSALAVPGEDVNTLTDAEIKEYEAGAKIDLVAEQAMINTIWTLKACMLLLYNRLTLGVRSNRAVKFLGIYVAVGWVAVQIAFFTECRPFSKYWQIRPTPNLNCEVLYQYMPVQATFNITSDIAMLFIPMPMIWGVKVALKQKLVLLVVFSMGLFVIAAALCTKIEYWISIYSTNYLFWYSREASVAIYVANMPCIWPLMREFIPGLRSISNGGRSAGYNSKYGQGTTKRTVGAGGVGLRSMRGHGTINEIGLDNLDVDLEDEEARVGMGFKQTNVTTKRVSTSSDEGRLLALNGAGIRAETTIEMTVDGDNDEAMPPKYKEPHSPA